jgi:CheY-like chemotaxis protein
MVGDRERCLAAGMDDYIIKPIRSNTLHDVLSRWLSNDGPSEAVTEHAGPVEPQQEIA